jgi:ketosteroid isomerase-like protein
MKRRFLSFCPHIAAVTLAFGQSSNALSSPPGTAETRGLFETIAGMDAKLFDAFNAHKIDAVMAIFSDDLEFYQDNDGVSNYQQTKNDFTKMLASVPDISRDLVKGSLEVYPVKDYGAIEIGVHRFRHTENGDAAGPARTECGSFKFVHIWRKTGDSWKLARVISYGH